MMGRYVKVVAPGMENRFYWISAPILLILFISNIWLQTELSLSRLVWLDMTYHFLGGFFLFFFFFLFFPPFFVNVLFFFLFNWGFFLFFFYIFFFRLYFSIAEETYP